MSRCWWEARGNVWALNLLILFRKKATWVTLAHFPQYSSYCISFSLWVCFYVNKLRSSLGDRSHSIWDYKDLLDHPVWPTRDSLKIENTTIGLCQEVKKKELAKRFSMLFWFWTYLIVLWSLPKWASKVIVKQLCLSRLITFHTPPFVEEMILFAKYEAWRHCSLNFPSTFLAVNKVKG